MCACVCVCFTIFILFYYFWAVHHIFKDCLRVKTLRIKVEFRLGIRLRVTHLAVIVRLRSLGMHYIKESPHKGRVPV